MSGFRYFTILMLVFGFGCSDVLDLEPTDSLTIENAIENEQDLKKAILGCYDALQSESLFGRMLLVTNDLSTDIAYNGGTIIEYDPFNKNTTEADNYLIDDIWSAAYAAINRCNTAIYFTKKLENITPQNKTQYLSELYFIRALCYYYLTQMFNEVPLRLTPTFNQTDLDLPVSSQQAIIEKLYEDLNFANGNLTNESPIYATDLAVKTLLVLINVELENYAEAIKLCNFIIESEKELVENYEDLFLYEENQESIFEINYTELLTDKNRIAEYCHPTSLGGRYEIAPEEDFLTSFDTADTRRNVFQGDIPYCKKYESLSSGQDNVYIFRLAVVYLLRAEARLMALGNLSLIRKDINIIRQRAGLDDVYTSSYDELFLVIENERKHEFAFEGKRRMDLLRTGRLGKVLEIAEKQYFYPIPLSEKNANNKIN